MTRSLTVRPASAGDFDAVAALLEVLGRPAVGGAGSGALRTVYEEQLADPLAHHLVASRAGGEVVAFCSLHFRARLNFATLEAWIPDLIVAPEARRAGFAQALLGAAVEEARERGCHGLTLESGYQRLDAHRLYQRFGMTDAGKQFYVRLGKSV